MTMGYLYSTLFVKASQVVFCLKMGKWFHAFQNNGWKDKMENIRLTLKQMWTQRHKKLVGFDWFVTVNGNWKLFHSLIKHSKNVFIANLNYIFSVKILQLWIAEPFSSFNHQDDTSEFIEIRFDFGVWLAFTANSVKTLKSVWLLTSFLLSN